MPAGTKHIFRRQVGRRAKMSHAARLEEEYEAMRQQDQPEAAKQLTKLSRQANGDNPRHPSFTSRSGDIKCDSLIVRRQAGPVCLLEAAVTARTSPNASQAAKKKARRDTLREWEKTVNLSDQRLPWKWDEGITSFLAHVSAPITKRRQGLYALVHYTPLKGDTNWMSPKMATRLHEGKMVQLTTIIATRAKEIGEDNQMEEENHHAFTLWAQMVKGTLAYTIEDTDLHTQEQHTDRIDQILDNKHMSRTFLAAARAGTTENVNTANFSHHKVRIEGQNSKITSYLTDPEHTLSNLMQVCRGGGRENTFFEVLVRPIIYC